MRYLYIEKVQRLNNSDKIPDRAMRITEEFEKADLPYDFAYNTSISITYESGEINIKVNGKDILDYSHIIFGGHQLNSLIDYEIKRTIVEHVFQYNQAHSDDADFSPIRVQNGNFILNMPFYSKLQMAKLCIDAGLPFLATYYDREGSYKDGQSPFNYPIITKHVQGINDLVMIDGEKKVKKNVFLVDKESGWQEGRLAKKNLSNFFVQEFADSGEDFRYFVSLGKVVGGWKRVAGESHITVNRKMGAKYFYDNNPSDEIKQICATAADKWQADFMALDFMYNDGKPYILEFSMHPGFKAYETKCEDGEPINVANTIVSSFK